MIREHGQPLFLLVVLLAPACDSEGLISEDASTGDDPTIDRVADPDVSDPCESYTDADGDTIADQIEGDENWDDDDIPNHLDPDSDGDTIPDSVEAGDDDLCTPPVNSDWGHDEHGNPTGDDLPDFLDTDSDDDTLADRHERRHGTDPTRADTDGDMHSDLVEVYASSDPLDPESVPPEDVFVIFLPFRALEHEILLVRAEVTEGPVDVQGLAVDVAGDPPAADYDSTVFVRAITPYDAFPAAPEGFSSMDGTTFYDVAPGTLVQFELDLYNRTVVSADELIDFRVWIDVVGDGSIIIDSFLVVVLVPVEDSGWSGP